MRAALDRQRTNAAMCRSCPHFYRPNPTTSACRVRGGTVTLADCSTGVACPKGWHTRKDQIRWWGFLWWGVPAPRRVVLSVQGVKLREPLPGCGCLVWLKALTDRLGLSERVGHALAEVLETYGALLRRL